MFTGLIQAIGRIASIEQRGADARMRIDAGELNMSDVRIGDSIAVSGICLTAVEVSERMFSVDVSGETLARTTLGDRKAGGAVNLEKALLPTTRLGGHLVSGHVDGVGTVRKRHADGRSIRFDIEVPGALAKYIAEKGSICVDGVSLTVNGVDAVTFDVNIIPHTAIQTTLGELYGGTRVNLEVDLLARYLERLLLGEQASSAGAEAARDLLARHRYLK
jgi:riboflavin synthase